MSEVEDYTGRTGRNETREEQLDRNFFYKDRYDSRRRKELQSQREYFRQKPHF